MAVVRWTFHDPVTDEDYEFEVNPRETTEPQYEKSLTYENTAGNVGGRTLIYEGRDEPQRLTWKGAILTEAQHLAFIEWWSKRYQIDITDDLGEEYKAYIVKYQPERKRAVHYPHKREYSAEAVIIGT